MVIPKLVNWPKASFNITFQGQLNRNGSNSLGSVPTDAERAGDFSGAGTATKPVTIFDPLNNAPFAGNIIPTSRLNPAAAWPARLLSRSRPIPGSCRIIV